MNNEISKRQRNLKHINHAQLRKILYYLQILILTDWELTRLIGTTEHHANFIARSCHFWLWNTKNLWSTISSRSIIDIWIHQKLSFQSLMQTWPGVNHSWRSHLFWHLFTLILISLTWVMINLYSSSIIRQNTIQNTCMRSMASTWISFRV